MCCRHRDLCPSVRSPPPLGQPLGQGGHDSQPFRHVRGHETVQPHVEKDAMRRSPGVSRDASVPKGSREVGGAIEVRHSLVDACIYEGQQAIQGLFDSLLSSCSF